MSDQDARRQGGHDAQDASGGHEASRREIARLAEEVLPALIGRLGASDLGELEVREGDWRVRLRKPATGPNGVQGASSGGRSKRRRQHQQQAEQAQRGAGQASVPSPYADGSSPAGAAGAPSASVSSQASVSSPGSGSAGAAGSPASSGNGAHPPMAAVGPGRGRDAPAPRHELARRAATSPAVGYYLPNEQLSPGHRVHEGDLLGHIDVLGVRQDVVSPADGVIGRLLARSGEAVEYGQELLRIDLVPAGAAAGASAGQGGPAGPGGSGGSEGSGGSGGSVGRAEPSTEA